MFYKLKIYIFKSLRLLIHIMPGLQKLFKLMRLKTGDDIRSELIKKYVKGKSFVDIGCMWRVDGYFSFLAEESGSN